MNNSASTARGASATLLLAVTLMTTACGGGGGGGSDGGGGSGSTTAAASVTGPSVSDGAGTTAGNDSGSGTGSGTLTENVSSVDGAAGGIAPDGGTTTDGGATGGKTSGSTQTGDATNATIASIVDPMLTTPLPDATSVSLSTPLTIAYTNPVNPAATTTAILSTAQGKVDGDVMVANGSIIFVPRAPLSPLTTYTFSVSTEVPDGAGVFTRTGYSIIFKTAAAT